MILHKAAYPHAEYEAPLNQAGHPIYERAQERMNEETTP